MDIPRRLFELFAGNKRARVLPTLIIAAIVTAVVTVPLTIEAVDARDEVVAVAADARLVVADTAESGPFELDGATIRGAVLVSVTHPTAAGVSFNLFAAGAASPVVASQDLDGPHFDLVVGERGGGVPLDTTLIPNGRYELFVTIATDGAEQRTAVAFAVENG